jgi:hypothetical protein
MAFGAKSSTPRTTKATAKKESKWHTDILAELGEIKTSEGKVMVTVEQLTDTDRDVVYEPKLVFRREGGNPYKPAASIPLGLCAAARPFLQAVAEELGASEEKPAKGRRAANG